MGSEMCIRDSNQLVLPWSAAVRPSALKMTAKELWDEVIRRSRIAAGGNVLTAPHPNAWTVSRATNWLVDNPIIGDDEVAFIRNTISHQISVAESAALQQPNVPPPAVSNSGGSNWIGKYPYLLLIHAIIDDKTSKVPTNVGFLFRVVKWQSKTGGHQQQWHHTFGIWLQKSRMTNCSHLQHQ